MPDAPGGRTWQEAVHAVLPLMPAADVVTSITLRWGGARIYLPLRVARLQWRGAAPAGAAERFADDMRAQILFRGGTRDQALAVLLTLAQRHFVV